jgi:hypothetical protein
MRSIAEYLEQEIRLDKGMGYNAIMSRANIDAGQAVDEFNAALQSARSTLETQRTWLAEENRLLAELRKTA